MPNRKFKSVYVFITNLNINFHAYMVSKPYGWTRKWNIQMELLSFLYNSIKDSPNCVYAPHYSGASVYKLITKN